MKACEAMVKCLEKENVKVVFGYPGAAICPFYDSLLDSKIRHILVRHEANSAHAANGYARITGKPAVCIATSGPGATNLITGIATAYMDSIPLVVITGQVNCDQIGRDVFQEADITGAAEPFVKHSYLVKNAQDIPRIFKEAFYIAGSGRPGPVLIDLPFDIQNTEIKFDYPKEIDIRSYKPTGKGNNLQIKRVISALEEAKRPLICAGGGIFLSHAKDELLALSEKCKIPLIVTMMGLSAVADDYPLYFGMLGMHGKSIANKALNDCDLLILIGARVGDRAVRSPVFLQETTKIIHIDIDPAEIGKNIGANIPVVGDAKLILRQITDSAEPMKHTEWIEHLISLNKVSKYNNPEKGYINPMWFIAELSEKMPEGCILSADVGQNQIWASNNYRFKKGDRFITSGGMGTMGYAIPAAIGAKLADKECEVIAVCGDGGFQMQMMELATAVAHDISVKIIVMNNSSLGMVREYQAKSYNGRLSAVILDRNPDFVALAQAYGIEAMRVNDEKSARLVIEKLSSSKKVMLIECVVNPDDPTL
ncbi:MAG: biosynthetic-type acetolactate synthase large subunit [Oscillospiraceae bacterium]